MSAVGGLLIALGLIYLGDQIVKAARLIVDAIDTSRR